MLAFKFRTFAQGAGVGQLYRATAPIAYRLIINTKQKETRKSALDNICE